MEKKRFIFDLDRTLLTCDYNIVETRIFEPIFGDKTEELMKNIGPFLDYYEMTHTHYDDEVLSEFLKEQSGLPFTPEIIRGWAREISSDADTMEDGVIELLEHLKSKDKSLVVLTNWYGKSQIPRLKEAGIYDYFDLILTGEDQLKPHPRAYLRAIDGYDPRECFMVGDSVIKDYGAPRLHGIESVLYDKEDVQDKKYVKIKKLKKLIKK